MTEKENEVWRDIEDWPFNQVSNLGRVRILPGGRGRGRRLILETELRILSLDNKTGYVAVGAGRRFSVHRLVLNTFRGPCPPGMESRHLNGNKTDNRLENLEWGTPDDNYQDRIMHGTDNKGEHNPRSKLTESDVIAIRNKPEYWGINMDLAKQYKVHFSTISNIRKRRIWEHVYDIPKYPPMHLIPDMEPIEYPQIMLSFGG